MAPGVFSQPFDPAAAGTARWMTRHLRLAVPLPELRLPTLNQKLTVVNEAGPDRFARHKGIMP
jgi:hypothetical protein